MLTRSKTSSTCTTHVADNMEIIYNVVILFFSFNIHDQINKQNNGQ